MRCHTFLAMAALLAQGWSQGEDSVCSTDQFERLGSAALTSAPAVRHRASIPYSHLVWMPEVLGAPGSEFPAVFRFSNSSCSGLGQPGAASLDDAGERLGSFISHELHRFGAAVIRGLDVKSAEDFSQLMHATGLELREYVGGVTLRPVMAPKVTVVSGEDPSVSMEPHNDNPYWKRPMLRLALFCQVPPKQGGQGLLTDGRKVLEQLRAEHPDIVHALKERQIRYLHFFPDAEAFDGVVLTSWQAAYAPGCNASTGCDVRSSAENHLKRDGHGYEWIDAGLKQWTVTDAIKIHPTTGEETWTNQLAAMHCSVFHNHPAYPDLNLPADEATEPCRMHGAMPYHTAFGDGEEFPASMLEIVRRVQWENSVAFDYKVGDVILIDNYLAMHGRFSFEVPREMFLSMLGGPLE